MPYLSENTLSDPPLPPPTVLASAAETAADQLATLERLRDDAAYQYGTDSHEYHTYALLARALERAAEKLKGV